MPGPLVRSVNRHTSGNARRPFPLSNNTGLPDTRSPNPRRLSSAYSACFAGRISSFRFPNSNRPQPLESRHPTHNNQQYTDHSASSFRPLPRLPWTTPKFFAPVRAVAVTSPFPTLSVLSVFSVVNPLSSACSAYFACPNFSAVNPKSPASFAIPAAKFQPTQQLTTFTPKHASAEDFGKQRVPTSPFRKKSLRTRALNAAHGAGSRRRRGFGSIDL